MFWYGTSALSARAESFLLRRRARQDRPTCAGVGQPLAVGSDGREPNMMSSQLGTEGRFGRLDRGVPGLSGVRVVAP